MFIIISLLVLSFLIIVHEAGHFITARLSGVQVDEFSVGFGPKLIGWQPAGQPTQYNLRLFPLGGYVKMAGMEPGDEDNPNGFNKKPLFSRMMVILAGSLTNFITAVLLFIILFSFLGTPTPADNNQIGQVVPQSPAAQVGLQPGDRILRVNRIVTANWQRVADTIHQSESGTPIRLTVVRRGEQFSVNVTPRYDQNLKMNQIGISPGVIWVKQGVWTGIRLGLQRTVTFTQLILQGIGGMVTGSVPARDIAGPVGITQMIGDAVKQGAGYLLNLTAILGINLALVNMLPIPALDGSRFIFLIIEGLRGKPVDPDKENLVHLIGFALLMLLFLVITYNDIVRLFTGG